MFLAEALTKYYHRSRGRAVFRNGLSLNQLALLMWEESSACGIDPSVLSKVLSGKRLFTASQLRVFCTTLGIRRMDRDYLFYCLYKDYCRKDGVKLDAPFISSSDTYQFIEALLYESEALFLVGNWKGLYSLSGIMLSYLHGCAQTFYRHNPESVLMVAYQKLLYLHAKGMGSVATQDTIMQRTSTLARNLRRYAHGDFIHLMPGYIESFKSSAYRVRGLFPTPLNPTFNRTYAVMSGRCAAKAMALLPPTNNEYLACLRNVMDSAVMLEDKDTFLTHLKDVERLVFMQPAANFLATMQLAGTVGKGMAVFKAGDPFALKEKVEEYFNRNLAGTRVYELSDIKVELETHVALQAKKNVYLQQRIQRALTLASEESNRYTDVIRALAGQL